jgi:hypothetical protein
MSLLPDDQGADDGVLVARVEDLDVEVVRVRVDDEKHETLESPML